MLSNDNRPFSSSSSSAPCINTGFLQKNNSLDEKGRMVGAFSQKQQLVSELSEREQHFRRTETDFSNLFARGKTRFLFQLVSLPCLVLKTEQTLLSGTVHGTEIATAKYTEQSAVPKYKWTYNFHMNKIYLPNTNIT